MLFIDRDGRPIPCTPRVNHVNLKNLSFEKGSDSYVEQLDGSKRVFNRIRLLSQGSHGNVFLYQTNDKQHAFVVKEFEKDNEFEVEQGLVLSVGAMCGVVHSVPLDGKIIMHQYDGDLEELTLHVDVCVKIAHAVGQMVSCLWTERAVVYADIKIENILYRCEKDNGFVSIALGDIGSMETYTGEPLTEYIATYPLPSKKKDLDLARQRTHLTYVETKLKHLLDETANNMKKRKEYKSSIDHLEQLRTKTKYYDLLEPLSRDNIPSFLAWQCACLFFVLIEKTVRQKRIRGEELSFESRLRHDEFGKFRKGLCDELENKGYTTNKMIARICEVFLRPEGKTVEYLIHGVELMSFDTCYVEGCTRPIVKFALGGLPHGYSTDKVGLCEHHFRSKKSKPPGMKKYTESNAGAQLMQYKVPTTEPTTEPTTTTRPSKKRKTEETVDVCGGPQMDPGHVNEDKWVYDIYQQRQQQKAAARSSLSDSGEPVLMTGAQLEEGSTIGAPPTTDEETDTDEEEVQDGSAKHPFLV